MWRRLIYHPDINYALRQTLVLCLPVAVGLMLGELRFGLLFSLVPACCNIAGLDTPHKRFFKRLIIGASLFATCSLLTQLLLAKDVPLPFLLTGLTLVLGVTAELGPLHAKLLPASLLAAIFTLSLAGEEKNKISHRGKALALIKEELDKSEELYAEDNDSK